MILLPRRQFLRCLTGVIAAPAVVKADSLMKLARPIVAPLYHYTFDKEWCDALVHNLVNRQMGVYQKLYCDAVISGEGFIKIDNDGTLINIPRDEVIEQPNVFRIAYNY